MANCCTECCEGLQTDNNTNNSASRKAKSHKPRGRKYLDSLIPDPTTTKYCSKPAIQADSSNVAEPPVNCPPLRFVESLVKSGENAPCFMPQPNDDLPSNNFAGPMDELGPWATGRVDWSPLAGLTGTRPIVDHYSITRYSGNEWRQRNQDILSKQEGIFNNCYKVENDSCNSMARTYAMTDQTQKDSTHRLMKRSAEIQKWKLALERAINAQAEEIAVMEEQRNRLKQSLAVLQKPESIATECLDRRCGRPDSELVRDMPEEELIREIAMIKEIGDLFTRTLNDITQQQLENRTARERLEYDWSDKKDASEILAKNCALNNTSTTALFKPGAVRFIDEQASEIYWEQFSVETLDECERTRQKSVTMRGTLDAILTNAARDLRSQADRVEQALSARIACMDEIRVKLENDLNDCLRHLAETELLIDRLTSGMQNLDNCMKVAQTRLDNCNSRQRVENCRDKAQMGLLDEVKVIQDGVTAMLSQIKSAEDAKTQLMKTRGNLEREIMLKRRSIMLDRDRCMVLRSHFPSASALSGRA